MKGNCLPRSLLVTRSKKTGSLYHRELQFLVIFEDV